MTSRQSTLQGIEHFWDKSCKVATKTVIENSFDLFAGNKEPMAARVVMGAGIDTGEPAFPVANDWECFLSIAAKETVFDK